MSSTPSPKPDWVHRSSMAESKYNTQQILINLKLFQQLSPLHYRYHTSMSSSAVVLSSGFFTRHLDTKSINSVDHLSGFLKDGGGLVGIINIACKINFMLYIQLHVRRRIQYLQKFVMIKHVSLTSISIQMIIIWVIFLGLMYIMYFW